MNLQQMQIAATKDGLDAKRDFETEAQARKVRALVEQVRYRLDALARLNDEIHAAVNRATDQPVQFPAGAFGHDTDTLDHLLAVLTEESSALDNMRAAAAKTEELQAKYEALIEQETSRSDAEQESAQVGLQVVGAPGQYL